MDRNQSRGDREKRSLPSTASDERQVNLSDTAGPTDKKVSAERFLHSLEGLTYEFVYFDSSAKLFDTLYSYPPIVRECGTQRRGDMDMLVPTKTLHEPPVLPVSEIHFLQRAARWASLENEEAEETEDNASHNVIHNAQLLKDDPSLIERIPQIMVFRDTTGKIWTINHRRLAAYLLSGVIDEVPVQWADVETATRNLSKYYPLNNGRSLDIVNRFQGWAVRVSHPCMAVSNEVDRVVLTRVPETARMIVTALLDGRSDLPDWISTSCLVQRVIALNLKALSTVTRKNGDTPYIDHLIRLGVVLDALLPQTYPRREETLAGAINHDYLEEGPGVSVEAVQVLRALTGEISAVGFLAAILLTEPAVTFENYRAKFNFVGSPEDREKQLEKSAYVVQVRDCLYKIKTAGDADLARALADIVLADKIVNAGDFDFVFDDQRLREEDVRRKISLVTGTYGLVLSAVSEFASPILVDALQHAIKNLAARAALDELDVAKSCYNAWVGFQSVEGELSAAISKYHSDTLELLDEDFRPFLS